MKHKSIALFLARRLLFSKNDSYPIKIIIWVCFSTIIIGTMSLTLIFAIMQGFETETEQKLQSINPQITLQSPIGDNLNFTKIKECLIGFPNIDNFAPSTSRYGVLHNPNFNHEVEFSNISIIKGIDPNYENLVSKIETKIENGLTLKKSLKPNHILIGIKSAETLNTAIGELISIFIPTKSNTRTKNISFEQIDVFIGGIFKTGISEFDNNLIITSLDFIKEHFNDFGISEIGIKLKTNSSEEKAIHQLKSKFGLIAYSWKEPYSAIVSALKLEKHTAVAIAFLIILISCMTLISLLFMLITKHTNTIATLKVMGLSQNKIQQAFTLISLILTVTASTIGTLLAAGVGYLIKNYYFIELPDVYYITTLPIQLSLTMILFIISTTTLIALITSQVPLKLISKLNISQLLKTNN